MNKLVRNTVMRTIKIDAGHRIYGHENKCASLHGHEYKFDIYATRHELDDLGRVIDFGVIKSIVGQWLIDHWDHGMILWKKDPLVAFWDSTWVASFLSEKAEAAIHQMAKQKVYLLPHNPTAENLAHYLMLKANYLLVNHDSSIVVKKIVCWETSNCCGIAEL